ncbi:hypothetical protein HMSSN036_39670 [Paenibacillus macerans]|nr:hypothetical protein HMSSN036_39670 [Paenibacillus macerans]
MPQMDSRTTIGTATKLRYVMPLYPISAVSIISAPPQMMATFGSANQYPGNICSMVEPKKATCQPNQPMPMVSESRIPNRLAPVRPKACLASTVVETPYFAPIQP